MYTNHVMAFRALLPNGGVGHEVLSFPYRIEDQIKAKWRCHLVGMDVRHEERCEEPNLRLPATAKETHFGNHQRNICRSERLRH